MILIKKQFSVRDNGYSNLVCKIISVEEKLDNEVLQDFYDLNLKFYLYISLYYKTLWCDKIQTKWIGKTMDYIKLLKEGNVWMSDIVTETITEYSLKA